MQDIATHNIDHIMAVYKREVGVNVRKYAGYAIPYGILHTCNRKDSICVL